MSKKAPVRCEGWRRRVCKGAWKCPHRYIHEPFCDDGLCSGKRVDCDGRMVKCVRVKK